MSRLALFLILVLLLIAPAHAQAPLPAFPGAEGFGAVATGGRGGQVITVTTLAADGPGSLAEALATPGARTIVFAVSGVIDAFATIIYGDVTIAGQTSPGGITVRGLMCDGHYDAYDCDNLIIRHLRSRPALHLGGEVLDNVLDDALRLDGVENVMIDHLSLANASDEAVQISMARNVTIQNTLIAETVGDHHIYGGMLINYSHSQRPQDNLSIHHNTWYRITGRLPEISCELTRNIGDDDAEETPSFCSQQPLNIEVTSNLLYDVGGAMTYGDNSPGGYGQQEAGLFWMNLNWVDNLMMVPPDFPFGMMDDMFTRQPANRFYFAGNQMNIYPQYGDTEIVYCCNDFAEYHPNTDTPAAEMLAARHPFPPISTTPADQLVGYALGHVGAFPRDPMDRRIMAALAAGEFSTLPPDQAGAEDALTVDAAPPPPQDTDGDGMPDVWETTHGLDPAVPDHNGTALSPEGYTNIEVYLNALAEQRVAG